MELPSLVLINLLNFVFLAMAFLAIYQYAYRLKMALEKSRRLQKESDRYRELFDTTWDGVFQLDRDGCFVLINQSGAAMLGLDEAKRSTLIGQSVFSVVHDIDPEGQVVQALHDQGFMKSEIIQLKNDGQANRFVELTINVKRDDEGEIAGYGGIFRDVTARIHMDEELRQYRDELESLVEQRTAALTQSNLKLAHEIEEHQKADQIIKKSLREKELLLKEIHHRVKNNLQVVVSLINLQSRKVKNAEASAVILECQERIRSIALVHEKLYASSNFSEIRFDSYVRTLVLRLYSVFNVEPNQIQLDVDIDALSLGIDLAIPCGLIINELISNAFKHAFPNAEQADKRIGIRAASLGNSAYELEVFDNGIGLPSNYLDREESLGMKLIQLLVEDQLAGELHVDTTRGSRFLICFNQHK